jgi:hypothetical protein
MVNGEDGIDDCRGKFGGERRIDLGGEGGFRYREKEVAVDFAVDLECVEKFEGLGFCDLEAVSDDSWVEAFCDVSVGLFEKLADEEDDRGRAIAGDLVLSCGGARYKDGLSILDQARKTGCSCSPSGSECSSLVVALTHLL